MPLLLIAVILGVVEGLPEFLPVSSTGHLILAGQWLGYTGEEAGAFEIIIQLGASLALAVLFRAKFAELLRARPGEGFHGRNGLGLLLVTTLPALVIGFLTHHFIKGHLF